MARGRRKQDEPALLDSLFERALGTGPLRRLAVVCAWLFLAGGLILAFGIGLPHLAELRASEFDGSNARISIEDAPEWFTATPDIMRQIEDLLVHELGTEPTDRSSLVRAHAILEESGWFHEITRLHRESDGTIRVSGTLVRPFAVVRWGSFDILVDARGRLLNLRFPRGQASPELPVIIGARTPPPTNELGDPVYGGDWTRGKEIAAGLELLLYLQSRSWRTDIQAVDVATYPDSHCLWLSCEGGVRIRWGLAPGETSAAELTSSEKLHMIDSIQAHYGPLNSLSPTEIDVRHDLSTISAVTIGSTE